MGREAREVEERQVSKLEDLVMSPNPVSTSHTTSDSPKSNLPEVMVESGLAWQRTAKDGKIKTSLVRNSLAVWFLTSN